MNTDNRFCVKCDTPVGWDEVQQQLGCDCFAVNLVSDEDGDYVPASIPDFWIDMELQRVAGRPATQIELEMVGAICKLQDENRELKHLAGTLAVACKDVLIDIGYYDGFMTNITRQTVDKLRAALAQSEKRNQEATHDRRGV